MRPIGCIFDIGVGSSLMTADLWDQIWLVNIRQRDLPEIRSAPDTKLVVSGIITIKLRMGISCTRVTFGVVDRLSVLVLLGTNLIDKFI